MIRLQHLQKYYIQWNWQDLVLFEDLDLEIKTGEFIAIMGSSGSGKSTLLNMISLLDVFQWGSIDINSTIRTSNDLDVDKKALFRWQNISFVFQQFHLLQHLTVEENVDLVIELNKISRRFQTQEILDLVGLWSKSQNYPFQLSGWEQQRVAIARAFVWDTPILLADEPTWNLDTTNATHIMNLLVDLHQKTQNTIVMITHDPQIASYADKTYVLADKTLKEHV